MKNLVICISDFDKFDEDYLRKEAVDSVIASAKKVHLLHVFETTFYNNEFSQYSWPDQKDYPEIKSKVEEKLKECSTKLGLKDDQVEISCLINDNVKDSIKSYLEDIKADMAVMATRQVGSFSEIFQSSLADYLIRMSPCNILILK